MTVGWAAHCDDGVVLISDSLFTTSWSRGPAECRFGRKIEWVGQRIAVVTSGDFSKDVWSEEIRVDGSPEDVTVDDVARAVYAQLKPLEVVPTNIHPIERGLGILPVFEAVIAGGPLGQAPELLVVRGDGLPPVRLERQIVMTGMARGWAKRRGLEILRPNPAETIAEAALLGAETVRDVIYGLYADGGRKSLQDYFPKGSEAMGRLPPAAFPIHIAVIRAHNTKEIVVDEEPTPTANETDSTTRASSLAGPEGARLERVAPCSAMVPPG